MTLLETVHLWSTIRVENAAGITLDLNGKTLGGRAIKVGGVNSLNQQIPGKLTVIDSSNGNGRIGLEISDGGTLEFKPDNKFTTLSQLQVYGSANVKLYGGRIENRNNLILGTDIKMNNLLPDGYAYRFYLGDSTHESLDYMKAATNDLSGWKSAYNLVPELCDHTKLESGFNEAKCPYCNSVLAATVIKDSQTTGYTTAQDAVNNADGGTVKLLADAGEITVSSELKLACNGHTIAKLTVNEAVALASLLPEGYAFKSDGTWVSDLSTKTLEKVTTAEAPVKSLRAKASNVTSTYGEQVTLEATAAINGQYSFEWYKVDGSTKTDLTSDRSYTTDAKSCTLPTDLAAGKYTYRLTYTKDGYSKSCDFNVRVSPKPLTDAMVGTIADQTYDGNAKTPKVVVKDGKTTLIKDKDYTVVYADNTNAGDATATIKGIGNYTGQVAKRFTIKQKALSEVNITVADGGTYDGKAKKPGVTVKDGKKTLIADTDYTLSYENNINAGVNTAKVTVTGEGKYSGKVVKNFSIAKADATCTALTGETLTYSGNDQELVKAGTVTGGKLVYSTEERGTYSETIPTGQNTGNYTVWYKVAGDENHYDTAPVELKAKITAKAVKATVTVEKESFVYNGKAHEPKVVVKDGNTTIAEKEYTVSYANSTNAGEATITITDKKGGNYVVSGDTNFIIAQCDISKVPVQVIFEKSLTYNGEPQKPQIISLTAGGLKMTSDEYKLKGNTATAAGTHEMTITGEGNFTGTAAKEFTIAQATVTTTDKPTQNTVYEGTEVSKVTFKEKKVTVSFNNGTRELEGTWSVAAKDGAMKFEKAGKYTCKATFTPSDKNFAPITMDVEITVTNRPFGGRALPTTEVVTIDKVTTSPAEVKNETKTDADGTKETISKVTVSDAKQKEIIKQVKDNKSEEIVINVSEKKVADNAKLEISLDKDFIDSIVKDTDAKLTIKTPEGNKTFTQEELKKLSESAAADGTVTVDPTASEPTDTTKAEKITKAKGLIEKLNLVAHSSKTAKKNAKVILKRNETTNSCIKELKNLGFTVKYRFYRSTKKSADYKSTVTKKTASYMNTNGKKGTKYFYKIQIRVYGENGKLIAKTALKQCKYASRIWSK